MMKVQLFFGGEKWGLRVKMVDGSKERSLFFMLPLLAALVSIEIAVISSATCPSRSPGAAH